MISPSQIRTLRQRLSNLAPIPKLSQAPNLSISNSLLVPLPDGFSSAAFTSGCFMHQGVTERRLYVPGSQQSLSVWGVRSTPSRREHQQAACSSGSHRLSEWVTFVLSLGEESGMSTSRGGGRQAHVKRAGDKGAERRLEPVVAHRQERGQG